MNNDAEAHYSIVADTILAPLRAADPTRETWPIEMKLLDMACKDARRWWEKHRDRLDDLPEAAREVERVFTDWKKDDSLRDMLEDCSAAILNIGNKQAAAVATEEQGLASSRANPGEQT